MIFKTPTSRQLTLILALLVTTPFTPAYALAEPSKSVTSDKEITLNFDNQDIRVVIAAMSKATGKNFLIDPRINGRITIISASPLRKDDIYDVFLDALRTHSIVAIEQGDVIKLIPLEEAKQNPEHSESKSRSAEQITYIKKMENVSATQLVPVLRPLMPREAYLQAYVDTNMLVISDSKKNIERLLKIIKEIDIPNSDQDEVVPLLRANAEDVLRILRETQPKRTETSAALTADKRTNSIIISGNKSERERYIKVIKHLDTPIANNSMHHVVELKYAKAIDLAPILDKVLNRQNTGTLSGGSSAPIPSNQPPGVPGSPSTTSPFTSNSSASYLGTNIIADEATNSLIISADMQSYQSLLAVLKKLDIPRLQVMIEAIIAEITVDNNKNIGIQWGSAGAKNGVANTQDKSVLGALTNIAGNNALASLTGGFSAIISKGDIAAMLNILRNDANTNILSAPKVLTLDNKEAEMIIGENVPFITGSYTPNVGTTSTPFQTVQRQDVGLTLKVKPQINQGGMITLEIYQETSAVKPNSNSSSGPTTTKRSIKSNVSIADGNVLALGGLMDNQVDNTIDSIPILGDIPYIGWLFKSQQTENKKKTLMVFIKPTIVDAQNMGKEVTEKYMSEIEKEQQRFNQRNPLLPTDTERYQLPHPKTPIPETIKPQNEIPATDSVKPEAENLPSVNSPKPLAE